jgi:hypothetical protein
VGAGESRCHVASSVSSRRRNVHTYILPLCEEQAVALARNSRARKVPSLFLTNSVRRYVHHALKRANIINMEVLLFVCSRQRRVVDCYTNT